MQKKLASAFVFLTLSLPSFAGWDEGNVAARQGDQAKAFQEYMKDAKGIGYPQMMYQVGIMYHDGRGTPRDDKQAFFWMKKAAEKGFDKAQYMLGLYYVEGVATKIDLKEALKWLNLAAQQGDPEAHAYLGYMYEEGIGVKADPVKAIAFYKKAAERWNNWALHQLGMVYFNGHGTPVNHKEAITYFQRAAKTGFASSEAQGMLAICYYNGYGVTKNAQIAADWALLAAEGQISNGYTILGKTYEYGLAGRRPNKIIAYAFYHLAASQGGGPKLDLERFSPSLTAQERQEGLKLATQLGQADAVLTTLDAWLAHANQPRQPLPTS